MTGVGLPILLLSSSRLRDSSSCSMMGGGVPTRSRGCRSDRLCSINFYLATSIYTTISSPQYISVPPSSLYADITSTQLSQLLPDTTISWALSISDSSRYPQISCTLASSLCIELLCSVFGWCNPQLSTVNPPLDPLQWVGIINWNMVASTAAFMLVSGIPNGGRYPFPTGGVGPLPTFPIQIVRLTVPPLYITPMKFLHQIPPDPRSMTPSYIYSMLSWNWSLDWFYTTLYTRAIVNVTKGIKKQPFWGAHFSINILFQ